MGSTTASRALEHAVVKQRVLDHYGGRCVCCGEDERNFLTLDHPDQDGCRHRKESGTNGGASFYSRLIKNNFETTYRLRVLCANCNLATTYNRICPHQIEKVG